MLTEAKEAAAREASRAELRAVARALAALGGKGTVKQVAALLGVRPKDVARRLMYSKNRQILGWDGEFAGDACGIWRLTDAGHALVRDESHLPARLAGTKGVRRLKPRQAAVCRDCGRVRMLSPSTKPEVISPYCRGCADSRRRLPETYVEVADPERPTGARPGSPEKIATLAARVELWLKGQWKGPIFLQQDAGTPKGYSASITNGDAA